MNLNGTMAGSPEKKMWLVIPEDADGRMQAVAEYVARAAQQEGIRTEMICAPEDPSSWPHYWEQMRHAHGVPDIIYTPVDALPEKSMFPQTFMVAGDLTNRLLARADRPDAVVVASEKASVPRIRGYTVPATMHVIPLDKCLFDTEHYARACVEVAPQKDANGRETIAVLIGSLSNLRDRDAIIDDIRQLAQRRQARLLISGSVRTKSVDWKRIEDAFAGPGNVLYRAKAHSANSDPDNPYYHFLAMADKVIALDSGSMAVDAAHIGKPVYANKQVIRRYQLEDIVLPFTPYITLDEPALPPLNVAGGIAHALSTMHEAFKAKQEERAGAVPLMAEKYGGRNGGTSAAFLR